jgi:hypothetical protein
MQPLSLRILRSPPSLAKVVCPAEISAAQDRFSKWLLSRWTFPLSLSHPSWMPRKQRPAAPSPMWAISFVLIRLAEVSILLANLISGAAAIVGIVVASYNSISVAAPILLLARSAIMVVFRYFGHW